VAASNGCRQSGGTVSCELGYLPDEGRAGVVITGTVNLDASGPLAASAGVSAFESDPDSANNDLRLVTEAAATRVAYENDFESSPDSSWSHPSLARSPGGRGFLGEFGNDRVHLELEDLPYHTTAAVTFDLYILRSWDGNSITGSAQSLAAWLSKLGAAIGPDEWELQADGKTLLHTTFSNYETFSQAFPGRFPDGSYAGLSGALEKNTLGYYFGSEVMDSVYHITVQFPHSGSSLALDFAAQGLQGLDDESWGLDHVEVELAAGANGRPQELFMPLIAR
jgi:hypothetical protein